MMGMIYNRVPVRTYIYSFVGYNLLMMCDCRLVRKVRWQSQKIVIYMNTDLKRTTTLQLSYCHATTYSDTFLPFMKFEWNLKDAPLRSATRHGNRQHYCERQTYSLLDIELKRLLKHQFYLLRWR